MHTFICNSIPHTKLETQFRQREVIFAGFRGVLKLCWNVFSFEFKITTSGCSSHARLGYWPLGRLWVSRPLMEAKVVMSPPTSPLSRTHIRQHNLLTVCREFRAHKFKSFLFNLNPLHQITTQAELTNGVRHADPPDPMDDVLEVLMKNGGECLLKF